MIVTFSACQRKKELPHKAAALSLSIFQLFLADVLLDQCFQFSNLLILFIQRIFQAFNLLGHGRPRRRHTAALTDLKAQAGIEHVFPVAEVRTDAECRPYRH